MSRATSTVLAFLLLLISALPVAADEPKAGGAPSPQDQEPVAVSTDAEIVPGEVVVKWRDAPRGLEVARSRGLAVVAELGAPGAGLPAVLSTAGRPVEEVLGELRADPAVEYAEPNYRVQLATEGEVAAVGVNDPMTSGQYSLNQMRVRDAWSLTRGGNGLVAVLDTGVQFNHPDLAGRLVAGHDFVNNDGDASDDNGHGTWVAGIVAANPNDGYGIAGISWSDRILPVKIMNREGSGETSDLSSGIIYAADRGATVINMSVGGFPYAQYLQDAINYAWSKGAVLVGAAGNNRRQEDFYPASFNNVISVSATQTDDEFSNWSSWGPKVDVAAPGSAVLTTNCYTCAYAGHDTWGSHVYISGTSFATPNVAGVVALLRARNPTWTPAQIVSRLIGTVDDRGYPGFDTKYGHGRVNAYRALGASVGGPGPSTGDGVEPNNTLSQARSIPLNAPIQPSIHPAGDVDVFGVDVPRAGRLDVRATGVVDNRPYPWGKTSLPIDPIVELYDTAGTLLARVDREWEAGTELAQLSLNGPSRILIRISNWYANGNTSAYTLTPAFVDTVGPVGAVIHPSETSGVARLVNPVATFNEPVTNVTAATLLLRDTTTGATVPSTVTYDPSTRRALLQPSAVLESQRGYRVEVTSGVQDTAGNPAAAASFAFSTGTHRFADTVGNPFIAEIDWLHASGITTGCSSEHYCPGVAVTREQMASFLARALRLPSTSVDYFWDDTSSGHHADINRIAAAGISNGCGGGQYCPSKVVTRDQMASFLARALRLPAATRDFFTDDAGSTHEADINRVAAAGITLGCGGTQYCPSKVVTRDQMAAFLYRALGR